MPTLAWNSYGKSAVRLTRVVRTTPRHELREFAIDIALAGDFAKVYTDGDNSPCIPTDTMKNTVYALAAQHPCDSPEAFGQILAGHFIDNFAHVSGVSIKLHQTLWTRIPVEGRPHDHAFTKAAHQRTAEVRRTRDGLELTGGLAGLEVLKTSRSAFCGFLVDAYTTLKDASERIFATTIDAAWKFTPGARDYNALADTVRDILLQVFATHDSKGVQHTLYAMGEAVLAAAPHLEEITLSMPNQHRILANIALFNLPNDNEVFITTSEPYGVIQGTIRR
ncbi:MAG TPA: urate oxidase [Phycisphaerae bacterium]|nr:urate oxidase [Phycisphaerae bacterium]